MDYLIVPALTQTKGNVMCSKRHSSGKSWVLLGLAGLAGGCSRAVPGHPWSVEVRCQSWGCMLARRLPGVLLAMEMRTPELRRVWSSWQRVSVCSDNAKGSLLWFTHISAAGSGAAAHLETAWECLLWCALGHTKPLVPKLLKLLWRRQFTK